MQLFGYAGQWPGHSDAAGLADYGSAFAASGGSAVAAGDVAFGRCWATSIRAREGCIAAICGHPVFAGTKHSETTHPAEELLAAYARNGAAFLSDVTGSFALAIVDTRSGTVMLALDRMGVEQLSYAISGRGIVFANAPGAVARAPVVGARLRDQAIFDYLLLHMVPAPDTVFDGVFKLRPGTCLVFRNGTASISRYWNPAFVESGRPSFPELKSQLQASLRDAVAASGPDDRTGAFLSGGLDSSSVAGMLCRVTGRRAPSFSIGFGVESFDELEYARIASRHFNSEPHEYSVTPEDVVTAFPQIAAAYDEPFGNSSAVPTFFCARLAASHGVTHLLAGDGGDEIFGGNERYVRQRVFEAYRLLPEGVRSSIVEPLTRLIRPEHPVMPLRKLRSYVDQARIPLPERLESWNFMYRTPLDEMLEPAFRASIDPKYPLRIMADVYASAPSRSMLHQMLFYDWHYTLSDNDLRKVGTMCRLAGVRVSYPMLDQRVVDVSLRVPPSMKIRSLELRHFYKQAMADFLPEAIIRKTKHGFGLPFGVWLKTHARLGDLIYSLLSDLKRRGYVRPAFLDRLVDDHRAGHPGYFGYAIWDLAMLEAWLKVHA